MQVSHVLGTGWQHCWLLLSAHPSVAGLHAQLPPWLASVVAVLPWRLLGVAAIAAGATWWAALQQLQADRAAAR